MATKSSGLEIEGKEDKKTRVLEKELEWIRQGAKARQAKQKARIKSYEELADLQKRLSKQMHRSLFLMVKDWGQK